MLGSSAPDKKRLKTEDEKENNTANNFDDDMSVEQLTAEQQARFSRQNAALGKSFHQHRCASHPLGAFFSPSC